MVAEREHHELQELLGAYALDAVEDHERAQVEEHLRGCASCRAELAEHRDTAAMLAAGIGAPPEQVWERIDSALETERPDRKTVSPAARRTGRWIPAAAAAAAAVLVAALGFSVVLQQQRLDRLTVAIGEERVVRAANDALLDPEARVVQLRGEGGTAEAVLLPDGTGYLVRDTLSPLPDDRTYQLWAVRGDTAVSAGLLGADPGVRAFTVDPDIQALAISEERRGGASAPTRGPVVLGEITTH